MEIDTFLQTAIQINASDVYLKADTPPVASVNGSLKLLEQRRLTNEEIAQAIQAMVSQKLWQTFLDERELNFAYTTQTSHERFRVNAYFTRGHMGLVMRRVKAQIPSVEELNLPHKVKELIVAHKGLILVTGQTGSGKSTSLASMLDYRNQTTSGHIITIEDPIEYIYQDKRSIISQREVGIDTQSFQTALKNALRQAPDVVLIGEIRDLQTAETALTMSETGHLVLATLHATNAYQTLERIISLFPGDKMAQMLMSLSVNLLAIMSQRLVPTIDESGRVVATELLINTPRIRELILDNNISEIKEMLKKSSDVNDMHSFDNCLFDLYEKKKISPDKALEYAESQSDMQMQMQGFGSLSQV